MFQHPGGLWQLFLPCVNTPFPMEVPRAKAEALVLMCLSLPVLGLASKRPPVPLPASLNPAWSAHKQLLKASSNVQHNRVLFVFNGLNINIALSTDPFSETEKTLALASCPGPPEDGWAVFPPPAVLGEAPGGKLGLSGGFHKLSDAVRFNRECCFSKEALQLLLIIRYDI